MIRTRFAPSPTGDLHIGGVRTALFSWLFARHHQGKFVLRIEDTDQSRSTEASIQTILNGLEWLGLDCDEGPYFQSKRLSRYQEIAHQLIDSEQAYFCHCSHERLEALRQEQLAAKQKPRYDGHCRYRNIRPFSSASTVIRFKNPTDGVVNVTDHVLGRVTFNNTELDDFIIIRSDGMPTYNFTVVVDDNDAAITHVIRGNDHLNNTPKQINLLQALNASIPVYMHLPMIHSDNGKKLSKRDGAANIMQYQAEGILPEALINYLVRLGWSHGDQEIFSKEALIHYFDGNHLSKSPSMLNPKKLIWINQHYLKQADPLRLSQLLLPLTTSWQPDSYPKAPLSEIAKIQCTRVKTLQEMAQQSRFFYEEVSVVHSLTSAQRVIIQDLYTRLSGLSEWNAANIYILFKDNTAYFSLKLGELFQILRPLLVGANISPPMDKTIELLGKARVLHRLYQAIQKKGP